MRLRRFFGMPHKMASVAAVGLAAWVAVSAWRPALSESQSFPGLISLDQPAPEFPSPRIEALAGGPAGIESSPAAGGMPNPEGRPLPVTPRSLPDLESGSGGGPVWINSKPLSMASLRGQVVMIDFWEYTCINCIRTFPENKKLYERYHQYGFEIIGVHDPEFDIAYSVNNVRAAVKRFALPYPVVADNFQIWNSYHNSTWPNRFLIDAKGVIRYDRPGEGADSSFERAIQSLLREAHPGLEFPSSYTVPPEEEAFDPKCGVPTEEMYVGDWDGRGILANAQGYHDAKTLEYALPESIEDGHAAVSGRWRSDKNGMTYRGRNKGNAPTSSQLDMRYHARELYSVMNVVHGYRERLYVKQDGQDLTPKNKGADVRFDENGHSYIEVDEPRMYYVVQNPEFGSHLVQLFPTRGGITINSFTFGNDCQVDFAHL